MKKFSDFVGMYLCVKRKTTLYKSKNHFEIHKEVNEALISKAKGILHIGAHLGQEAVYYQNMRKPVLWIEANPILFERLKENIKKMANQKAICALLGKHNSREIEFYLSSNDGASSSIYRFGKELEFEDLFMISQLKLPMIRLDSALTSKEIMAYDHWIIDTQGAELEVLQGAGKLIDKCSTMSVEVSRREVYDGGTKWEELKDFLNGKGFNELWEPKLGSHEDVIFARIKRN